MSLILRPGDDPPMLTPYCQICTMPVERFRLDVITSPHHIGIHANCCSRESSTRITTQVFLEMMATGQKLYVIVKKGSSAGLRGRAPTLRSISR